MIDEVVDSFELMFQKTENELITKCMQPLDEKIMDLNKNSEIFNTKVNAIRSCPVMELFMENHRLKEREKKALTNIRRFQCGICITEWIERVFNCGHAFCHECIENHT